MRVRARRLHDGRGVGRRSQQEGKLRHRSFRLGDYGPNTLELVGVPSRFGADSTRSHPIRSSCFQASQARSPD